MEKKWPEFKPLPELGNVANNYMSAFNVGMNIYEALTYLQGYVQITYNSMDDLINDWNNFEAYVTENINQIANEKTQEILNQWLEDGTLNELIATNPQWALKVNKAGDVMSGDLQFQENTGVYGTLHSGTKVNMISHSYTGTDDYTQIGDDHAQTVIHSEKRPVWYDGSQNQDLLVEEDLTPRENLLDNADFKSGIINQRGKSSYTTNNKNIFTIDRWKIYCGTVGVNNGYVKFTNTDSAANRAFDQTIGNQGYDTYTLYVNVRAIIGSASVQMMDESSHNILTRALAKGDNVLTAVGNVGLIRFFCTPNSSIEIYQVKLEKGSVYTGMPSWNEGEELNKCLYYFEKVGVTWQTRYAAGGDGSTVSITIPCNAKAKTPSVIVDSAQCVTVYEGSNTAVNLLESEIDRTSVYTNSAYIRFNHSGVGGNPMNAIATTNIYLDSETY